MFSVTGLNRKEGLNWKCFVIFGFGGRIMSSLPLGRFLGTVQKVLTFFWPHFFWPWLLPLRSMCIPSCCSLSCPHTRWVCIAAAAMQGLSHSSRHPSHGPYTWHGRIVHAHLLKHHYNHTQIWLQWGPWEYLRLGKCGEQSPLGIPLRHFYSSTLSVVPKLGSMWP